MTGATSVPSFPSESSAEGKYPGNSCLRFHTSLETSVQEVFHTVTDDMTWHGIPSSALLENI